jgi:Family of unknown function (DUF5752)
LFNISGRVCLLSKSTVIRKQAIKKQKNPNLLNSVLYENGFHFFIEIGKYTGVTANSTVEFREKLKIIPIQSVTFHFQRQDFQKWFKNTIGDKELAQRIDKINTESRDENLVIALSKIVQNRIAELQQHP